MACTVQYPFMKNWDLMFIKSVYIDQNSLAHSDSYVRNIPSITVIAPFLSLQAPVTFFVGENGTGKSTLLEAIAVAFGFNPEGGSKNYNFSSRDTHYTLCDFIKIIKTVRHAKDGFFLRAESYYNTATHSPILLAYPCVQIYSFDRKTVAPIRYRETEQYQVTKNFLD